MAFTREFLKGLGIEGDNLEKIMAEYGKSHTGNAEMQQKVDSLSQQVESYKSQIDDRDKQLADLKKSVGDNENLKNQIKELQDSNKKSHDEAEAKLVSLQKKFAVQNALRDAKAKDPELVSKALDLSKISVEDSKVTGLKEQLEDFRKSHDYLFDAVQEPKKTNEPKGSHITIFTNGNPSNGEENKKVDFSQMNYQQILKLKQENPEVFKQASEQLDKGE